MRDRKHIISHTDVAFFINSILMHQSCKTLVLGMREMKRLLKDVNKY